MTVAKKVALVAIPGLTLAGVLLWFPRNPPPSPEALAVEVAAPAPACGPPKRELVNGVWTSNLSKECQPRFHRHLTGSVGYFPEYPYAESCGLIVYAKPKDGTPDVVIQMDIDVSACERLGLVHARLDSESQNHEWLPRPKEEAEQQPAGKDDGTGNYYALVTGTRVDPTLEPLLQETHKRVRRWQEKQASRRTITVCPKNCDYTTLELALDASERDDSIGQILVYIEQTVVPAKKVAK